MIKSTNAETIVLHGGNYRRDPATGSVAVPIYQTTSYQFRGTEHAANLFALKELGNIYTRIMNPTTDVLEQRVAALEGGAAALAVSSGQAATAIAVQNIAQAGDNIVSSTDLYGGTWNLFANTFRNMGIEVRFVDPVEPDAFRRATDDKTRAYYAETLPNPKLTVFPIGEVAGIGRKLGLVDIERRADGNVDVIALFDARAREEEAQAADCGNRCERDPLLLAGECIMKLTRPLDIASFAEIEGGRRIRPRHRGRDWG